MISGEYGKTWKWLDVGLSFDRIDRLNPHKTDFYLHITYLKPTESRDPMYSINGDEFKGVIRTACRLNARIDLIKLFVPDSRHAFKVGGGGGIEFVENVWSHYESKDLSAWSLHFTRGWSGNVKVLYEYALTPKLSLGAFYLLEFGEDFGLSIRRNF
jgi:hypothetical protein